MVSENLKLIVKGNEYVMKFPTVGKIVEIDVQKSILSSGQYSILSTMGMETSAMALDKIDMQAVFNVLCPDLMKDLNVSNFDDLQIEDFNELRKIYNDKVVPWYLGVIDLIREAYKK